MNYYEVFIDSSAWVCESNLIGCSVIYRYLIENGHKIIDNPSNADFIIINSCGLTKGHIDRSINLFNKFSSVKKKNANIIMFGCLVKINYKNLVSLDLTLIDFNEGGKFDKIFYKKTKFGDIKPHCDNRTKQNLLGEQNPFHRTEIFPFLISSILFPFLKKARINYKKMIENVTYKNRIFLEISKGCTGNCNYCVIKKARGKICSRPIKDILIDIEKIKDPAKKLFLVANDCGCYGVDIKTSLVDLLMAINNKYSDLLYDVPMSMGRRIALEIKKAKDVSKIELITT